MRRSAWLLVHVATLLCPVSAAAAQSPADADRRLGDAVALHESGQRERAWDLLLSLVADHPRYHRGLWNVGLVYMENENPQQALGWFERAIAIDDQQAEYHLWLGYAYAKRLEQTGALRRLFLAPRVRSSFERAVELDPQHIQARRALMQYYQRAPGIAGGSKRKAREQAEAIRRLEALTASDSVKIANEPEKPRRSKEQDVRRAEGQQ